MAYVAEGPLPFALCIHDALEGGSREGVGPVLECEQQARVNIPTTMPNREVWMKNVSPRLLKTEDDQP